MLKEAIEKIRQMALDGAEIKTIEIDDWIYSKDEKGGLVAVAEKDTKRKIPDCIKATSLEGLVNWIKAENEYDKIFIEINEYDCVSCSTKRSAVREGKSHLLFSAESRNNTFREGYRNHEAAMIELRSKYQHTDDIDYLLQLLSTITLEDSVQSNDNGLTQQVTVRKGIGLAEKKTVKPIVKLKPYRTFYEVEQPESEFLVRINDEGKIGFYEADGGMWKMTARYTIKEYLEKALKEEINSGKITVTL